MLFPPMLGGPSLTSGGRAVSQASARAEEPPRFRRLMAEAQEGDQAAYAALLRDCVPLIRSLARQGRVEPGRVDDVVQEVLLTIHRARHTYDPARPFTPWLRAIVQRRAIDVARRQGRSASRELHAPLAYEAHADSAEAADQALVARERAARLAAAVQQLPPGQREALEQLGLRERSLAEVAALTGRNTGALKVNLHGALKSLRVILGSRDG